MLENVIEALNLNLKYYSSPERQLKYMSMKERESKMVQKLNPIINSQHLAPVAVSHKSNLSMN